MTLGNIMRKDALVSDCGQYRYWLSRVWRDQIRVGMPPLVFVMLNPSTADAVEDDPTIRRCIGFAKREMAGALMVMNLFALRSPKPEALRAAADPVGPDNDYHLKRLLGDGYATVVCAWGADKFAEQRASDFVSLMAGRELHCLGMTKGGAPKHPLYLPADAPLVRFNP